MLDVGPTDAPTQIELELTNGDTLRAIKKDPYGFWYLSLKSCGAVASPFDGAYTTRSEAHKAAQQYLNSRRLEVGPCLRPEPPKVKPGFNTDGTKKEK